MAPCLRYCLVAVLILVATETALMVRAEEPITPIGMLLVNPSAFHRKLLKVEGIVKEVRPYSKYEVTSVCGASYCDNGLSRETAPRKPDGHESSCA